MNNITEIDKFKQDKEREELKKLANPMLDYINNSINFLEYLDWRVGFTKEIEINTAYIDYKNKKVIINITNAYYVYQIFFRLRQNMNFKLSDDDKLEYKYKYSLYDGEKFLKDDGEIYNHFQINVAACKSFPNIENYSSDIDAIFG